MLMHLLLLLIGVVIADRLVGMYADATCPPHRLSPRLLQRTLESKHDVTLRFFLRLQRFLELDTFRFFWADRRRLGIFIGENILDQLLGLLLFSIMVEKVEEYLLR